MTLQYNDVQYYLVLYIDNRQEYLLNKYARPSKPANIINYLSWTVALQSIMDCITSYILSYYTEWGGWSKSCNDCVEPTWVQESVLRPTKS